MRNAVLLAAVVHRQCAPPYGPSRSSATMVRPSITAVSSPHLPVRVRADIAHCSSASTSAKSRVRPVARLFVNKATRPRNGTCCRRTCCVTRSVQAASNAPSLVCAVRKSIRFGGKPICRTMPSVVRSSRAILRSSNGVPKATSARYTRSAFCGVGSTQTPKSWVERDTPCTASACAPTTMKRASASSSAWSTSSQSSFNAWASDVQE